MPFFFLNFDKDIKKNILAKKKMEKRCGGSEISLTLRAKS